MSRGHMAGLGEPGAQLAIQGRVAAAGEFFGGDVVGAEQDDGGVVRAASPVGFVDEGSAPRFEGAINSQVAVNLLVSEHFREAIRAQQEGIAQAHRHLGDLNFKTTVVDIPVASQGAGDDVAERVRSGLLLGQDAGPYLVADPGVVLGQKLDGSDSKTVRPAIAEMG